MMRFGALRTNQKTFGGKTRTSAFSLKALVKRMTKLMPRFGRRGAIRLILPLNGEHVVMKINCRHGCALMIGAKSHI